MWGLVPVRGVFRQVTGNGTVSAAGDVTGTITVAARPVHTKNKRRDEHLPGLQRGPPDPGRPAGRTLAPLEEKVDHVRGSPAGRLILEYGDYECPYSRRAFHAIEHAGQQLGGNVRFAFRHFPLTRIHPHALAAAAAAEAAALQGRFWDMHELLFHRQKALEHSDLLRYAAQLGLDVAAFDRDRASIAVADRIRRDVDSGLASGQVVGTPTLFIDGVVHRGGYDPPTLLAALAP